MSGARITLVAAVGRNGVIGGAGKLPWRLRSDLQRFKAVTMGKPMLMGRKTYAAIGRPLPGRESIVLTRDSGFSPPGVHVVRTLDDAIARAQDCACAMGAKEIIVAGGGDIYAQTIDMAHRLDVTEVDLAPEGDAYFPNIDARIWRLASQTPHPAGPGDDASFTVKIYERAATAAEPGSR